MATRRGNPVASVIQAGSLEEAELVSRGRGKYELVLMDLFLPDVHGFSGFLQIQEKFPSTPIAIVTGVSDGLAPYIARTLGAVGYIAKTNTLEALAGHIADMTGGGSVFSNLEDEVPLPIASLREKLGSLSPAQRRVLFGLADGRLNKQIAGSLGVSEATVKAHLTSIYRKLKVTNRAQALLLIQPIMTEPQWDIH